MNVNKNLMDHFSTSLVRHLYNNDMYLIYVNDLKETLQYAQYSTYQDFCSICGNIFLTDLEVLLMLQMRLQSSKGTRIHQFASGSINFAYEKLTFVADRHCRRSM